MQIKEYINTIKEALPELSIEDYEINIIGQNNDVIIVNKAYVFRFPKYKEGIIRLKEETAILDYIKGKTPLSIPITIFRSFNSMELGKVFTGYKIIDGSPLWKEEFKKIKEKKTVYAIASQLVQFLLNLHTIKAKEILEELQLEVNNIHLFYDELFNKFKTKLYPYMRVDAQEQVTKNFESFLSSGRILNVEQSLIHGDFGASNILWDPKSRRISGIIDFGGSSLGDPAQDLAGILSSYGEDFFNLCIDLYPNGTELADRIKFYRSTFALQEALHGIEHNDEEAFENGIRDYR